jgi:hypothetical protein
MNSGFTKFIRQAIDCYESDPGVAWFHLQNAQDHIENEKGSVTLKDEKKAAKSSMKRTRGALKARLLEMDATNTAVPKTLGARQKNVSPPSIEDRKKYLDHIKERQRNAQFDHLLDVLVWFENRTRKSNVEAGATRQDVFELWGEDEILSIEECSDWKDTEKEYELAMRREPDFELYLLRKHLDWLDSSAGKIQADGPIPFCSSIPDHLKRYMYEANWCNLHGFDAACAALCGAILEEGIRVQLGVESFKSLSSAIEAASPPNSCLLTPMAVEAADKVLELRNLAAHGDQGFARRTEDQKKSSFSLTRELLDTIFPTES